MKVKIKRIHQDAVVPSYAKPGDAGMDLTAVECKMTRDVLTCHTGLSIEIPDGYVGLLYPRSSIHKKPLSMANSVGVIDSGYRGELILKFKIARQDDTVYQMYKVGDRIGQLIIMPYPKIEFEEVDHLDVSERGTGGFGSTGN